MEKLDYYGHFDNHVFGNIDRDISFLNGVLVALQFVNHKTDGVFDFSLRAITTGEETLNRIELEANDPRIKLINQKELNAILRKWLFNFVEGGNYVHSRTFVTDRKRHFSHSWSNDRESFISEFTNCLLNTIGAARIYHADIMRLGTEEDMVFLETANRRFVLSFSWESYGKYFNVLVGVINKKIKNLMTLFSEPRSGSTTIAIGVTYGRKKY